MADEYKRGANEQTNIPSVQGHEMKEENGSEKMGDRNTAEGDPTVVTKKNEAKVDIKMSTEGANENLNGGGSKASVGDDLDKLPEMNKEEKPKPVKKGLLDEPVVIEGKRQRHAVERLAAASPPAKRLSLDAVGSGTSLGDIEFVNVGISKAHNETLKTLHRLCYNTPGTATSRKRDLKKFNGYAFDDNSADFEKKKTMAMKLTMNELNLISRILGSERGHTKEEIVMSVLRFLQKPEDKGKKVPRPKKRRNSSKSSGKRIKRSKTEKRGKKGSTEKKKKLKGAGEEESSESDGAGQSEEEDESSGGEDSEESKSESKSATKIGSEKTRSPRKSDVSDTKSDKAKSEPTWGDGGPSNEEVETAIDEILRSVDLVNCTMKQMCERIAEKFPNLDMATYKSPLKERVKIALEKMEDS